MNSLKKSLKNSMSIKKATWTGRYWMTEKHAKKISKGLKKFYKTHQIWNKGKRIENPITNKIRRQSKEYYLKELERNAKNHFKYYTPERKLKCKVMNEVRKNRCGYFGKQNWTKTEISYLKKNFKKTKVEDMAIKLKRSYSSISHKLVRLRLIKNYKWK